MLVPLLDTGEVNVILADAVTTTCRLLSALGVYSVERHRPTGTWRSPDSFAYSMNNAPSYHGVAASVRVQCPSATCVMVLAVSTAAQVWSESFHHLPSWAPVSALR